MSKGIAELRTPPVAYCIDANYYKGTTIQQYIKKKRRQLILESKRTTPGPSYRVRKLTQLEAWRLMGFADEDFYKAQTAMNQNLYGGKNRSGSQLYKQAGNSIVVDVLCAIMRELYSAMPYLFEDMIIGSFFSGIGAFEKALSTFDAPSASNTDGHLAESDELRQVGYINDYNGDANRIYDGSTVARALKAEAGGGGAKTGWYKVQDGVIIDDTMGFDGSPRVYDGICPSLRASRPGLKTIGVIDPQGRVGKRCKIKEDCPTLRAQIHGNPPEIVETQDSLD